MKLSPAQRRALLAASKAPDALYAIRTHATTRVRLRLLGLITSEGAHTVITEEGRRALGAS